MASVKRDKPDVVLQILVDRILGVPQHKTAETVGYKNAETVCRVIEAYDLDRIETIIRRALGAPKENISAEAVAVNVEYDNVFGDIVALIKGIVDDLKKKPEDAADGEKIITDPIAKLQALNGAILALERTRTSRLGMLGAKNEAERKKADEQKDDEVFADLVDDDEDA